MNAVTPISEWSPTSWTMRPAQQQPAYRDPEALARAVEALSRLPPIVVSWEVEALKAQIAEAQLGERFLLQGGDCAETFADCDSGQIARKLKILLQMSLVLLHGMKKPVVRVGRFAGQYAKPRSGRADAAVLSRRPRQSPGIYARRARARSRTAAAWL
jgi:3-deoxy-7-phosphoheptulonate synthase